MLNNLTTKQQSNPEYTPTQKNEWSSGVVSCQDVVLHQPSYQAPTPHLGMLEGHNPDQVANPGQC